MSDYYFDEKTWHRLRWFKLDIEIGWFNDWLPSSWFTHRAMMLDPDLYLQAVQQEITTSWRSELEDILEDLGVDMLTWEIDDSVGDAWVQTAQPRWWEGAA